MRNRYLLSLVALVLSLGACTDNGNPMTDPNEFDVRNLLITTKTAPGVDTATDTPTLCNDRDMYLNYRFTFQGGLDSWDVTLLQDGVAKGTVTITETLGSSGTVNRDVIVPAAITAQTPGTATLRAIDITPNVSTTVQVVARSNSSTKTLTSEAIKVENCSSLNKTFSVSNLLITTDQNNRVCNDQATAITYSFDYTAGLDRWRANLLQGDQEIQGESLSADASGQGTQQGTITLRPNSSAGRAIDVTPNNSVQLKILGTFEGTTLILTSAEMPLVTCANPFSDVRGALAVNGSPVNGTENNGTTAIYSLNGTGNDDLLLLEIEQVTGLAPSITVYHNDGTPIAFSNSTSYFTNGSIIAPPSGASTPSAAQQEVRQSIEDSFRSCLGPCVAFPSDQGTYYIGITGREDNAQFKLKTSTQAYQDPQEAQAGCQDLTARATRAISITPKPIADSEFNNVIVGSLETPNDQDCFSSGSTHVSAINIIRSSSNTGVFPTIKVFDASTQQPVRCSVTIITPDGSESITRPECVLNDRESGRLVDELGQDLQKPVIILVEAQNGSGGSARAAAYRLTVYKSQ